MKKTVKKQIRLMYFHANWDGTRKMKDLLFSLCKEHGYWVDSVDCESKEGVFLSRYHEVKLCPYILVFKGDKEIKRGVAQEVIKDVFGEY
jgi:hypothetical protein